MAEQQLNDDSATFVAKSAAWSAPNGRCRTAPPKISDNPRTQRANEVCAGVGVLLSAALLLFLIGYGVYRVFGEVLS